MRNADDIVNALGGTNAVAKALSVPVSTVSSWKQKNSIPPWRRPMLLKLAMECDVALSTADFPDKLAA